LQQLANVLNATEYPFERRFGEGINQYRGIDVISRGACGSRPNAGRRWRVDDNKVIAGTNSLQVFIEGSRHADRQHIDAIQFMAVTRGSNHIDTAWMCQRLEVVSSAFMEKSKGWRMNIVQQHFAVEEQLSEVPLAIQIDR